MNREDIFNMKEKYPQQHEFVKEYIKLCEKYNLQIDSADILHISRFKNNYINLTDFIGSGLEGDIVYKYNNVMSNEEQLKFIKGILYGKE